MEVTRTSMFTGKVNTMDLLVTQEQLDRYARREGLIQQVFPNLSAPEREFIMTGVTPEEWAAEFGKPDTSGDDYEDEPYGAFDPDRERFGSDYGK